MALSQPSGSRLSVPSRTPSGAGSGDDTARGRHRRTAYSDDTLRHTAYRFADEQLSRAAVIVRGDHGPVIGHIETHHLLEGRLRDLREERERERVLATRLWQRSRA